MNNEFLLIFSLVLNYTFVVLFLPFSWEIRSLLLDSACNNRGKYRSIDCCKCLWRGTDTWQYFICLHILGH